MGAIVQVIVLQALCGIPLLTGVQKGGTSLVALAAQCRTGLLSSAGVVHRYMIGSCDCCQRLERCKLQVVLL
jgi:hypothetical protein